MQNRFLYAVCLILALSDLVLLNSAFFTAFFIQGKLTPSRSFEEFKNGLINVNLIWLVCSNLFQLYNKNTVKSIEQIFRRTWKSVVSHIIIFTLSISILNDRQFSFTFIALLYFCCALYLFMSRFACTFIETLCTRKYKLRKPVAVLGLNPLGLRLASFFQGNKKQFEFEGFLDSEESLIVDPAGNLLPGTCTQLKIAAEKNIKEVYVPLTTDRIGEAAHLLKEADRQCIRLKFVPDFSASLNTPFRINYMGEFPIISLREEPLDDIDNRFRKRLVDIIISITVIICILSWLFPLMAVIIKLQSKGPVLFKQLRNGRNNQVFYCYKFRSMIVNDSSDLTQATRDDKRVTSFGRFLRKSSIDELPQFFNVLTGEMSIVGPRPHMLKHTEEYRRIIDQYMIRQHLKPGITGWAQVNGFRGETNSNELMEKRVEKDIWYLENWSLMLDIKIIFLTIIDIFTRKNTGY